MPGVEAIKRCIEGAPPGAKAIASAELHDLLAALDRLQPKSELARRRKAKGYSAIDLANICSCSERTILRIEHGTHLPSAGMLAALRAAVGEGLDMETREQGRPAKVGR